MSTPIIVTAIILSANVSGWIVRREAFFLPHTVYRQKTPPAISPSSAEVHLENSVHLESGYMEANDTSAIKNSEPPFPWRCKYIYRPPSTISFSKLSFTYSSQMSWGWTSGWIWFQKIIHRYCLEDWALDLRKWWN